jgi:hypothetical protein
MGCGWENLKLNALSNLNIWSSLTVASHIVKIWRRSQITQCSFRHDKGANAFITQEEFVTSFSAYKRTVRMQGFCATKGAYCTFVSRHQIFIIGSNQSAFPFVFGFRKCKASSFFSYTKVICGPSPARRDQHQYQSNISHSNMITYDGSYCNNVVWGCSLRQQSGHSDFQIRLKFRAKRYSSHAMHAGSWHDQRDLASNSKQGGGCCFCALPPLVKYQNSDILSVCYASILRHI